MMSVRCPGGLPSCESSVDRAALAGRGPLLATIGSFYQAFAYEPDASEREVPDNIAVELDFLAYLAFKTAFAVDEGSADDREIATTTSGVFLRDHLGFWIAPFLESLPATGSELFRGGAAWPREATERMTAEGRQP